MPGSFFDKLGGLFGRRSEPAVTEAPPAEAPVAEAPATGAPVAEAPMVEATAEQSPPIAYAEPAPAVAEAPATDAYVASAPPVAEVPIVAQAPAAPQEPAPAPIEPAPPAPAAAPVPEAPAVADSPPPQPVEPTTVAQAAPEPAVEPSAAVAVAPPAAPTKSAEEIEEERLWAETDAAWTRGDFQTVTERLDALKLLEPEDAAAIDKKIAAAQYNHATQVEQSGELERALYLYQEARRRNPNLGEAGFAIERVQAALAPPPAPEPATEPTPMAEAPPPAERTYTVESGDSLSAIAEKMYGSAGEWQRIFDANRDQLDNPDLIQPGQTLRIPS